MKQVLRVALLGIFLLVPQLAAAQEQAPAPAAPVAPETQAVPVTPEIEQSPITLENSLTLRDPFSRLIQKPDFIADATIPELERYELDKFKLVGVITGPNKKRALMVTPDNKMHIVSESMRIGTKQGIVSNISPNIVLIEEKAINLLGQEEKIETKIVFQGKDKKKGML